MASTFCTTYYNHYSSVCSICFPCILSGTPATNIRDRAYYSQLIYLFGYSRHSKVVSVLVTSLNFILFVEYINKYTKQLTTYIKALYKRDSEKSQ